MLGKEIGNYKNQKALMLLVFLIHVFLFSIDRNLEGTNLNRLASKDSSRDIADSDTDKDTGKASTEKKPSDSPPILRYIKSQVKDGFHGPLAVLLKGAVLLSEEHFLEMIPVAWELLLEHNQEVAAAASSLFILAAVKAPQHVCDIMQNGLTNSDATVRINSILRRVFRVRKEV